MYTLKAYIPVRLAGLETLAGAVWGVDLFLVLVFISGVLGQEPPLPLVWASWTKGRSSFRAVMSRVSQEGAASNGAIFAEFRVGTGMASVAGDDDFVTIDGVDLLEGDGVEDCLEGDGTEDLLDGDGAEDLLEGDGAGDLLEGDGAGDLLEGDEADSLDGARDGSGLLDGD